MDRVGNNQQTNHLLKNLKKQTVQQSKLYDQISSGKKIIRPSDDPVGTVDVMRIHSHQNRNSKCENTILTADIGTNIAFSAINNTLEAWERVNEIAITAADGTKTESDRQGCAEELEQLLQHIVQLGNTTNGGKYIFSGSKIKKPPFRVEKEGTSGRIKAVFYDGDDTIQKAKSKDRGTIDLNLLGSNGGNPDKSGVFIDSNRRVNLFSSLILLRDKLLKNDMIGIASTGGLLDSLERGAENLTAAQVLIGGRQEILELDLNRLRQENSEIDKNRDAVEKADIGALVLELNNLQNVSEGSLSMAGRLFNRGNLLDYI